MLTAVYDLAVSPPTYDVIGFLLDAERERRGEDIKVAIVPGPKNGFRDDSLPPFDPATRLLMRQRIVEPMCRLLPACREVEVSERRDFSGRVFPAGWRKANPIRRYGAPIMVECAKQGLCPFVAPDPIGAPDTVVMTFRESSYWPTRNTNRETWLEAARILSKDWRVVLVPDTESQPFPDGPWVVDSDASFDLHRRANIYAGSRLNLFVNNGPAWLAAFLTSARSAIVRMEAEGAPCVSDAYFAACGLPRGSQMSQNLHIAWSGESVPEILRAVERGMDARPLK